ncbi:MAG TPA: hypothetical protein VD735_03655 [Candidatus Saccharimonadales bacterium]|nr:hypothetical protein [Candidatus Saccharimonadales bacterium]
MAYAISRAIAPHQELLTDFMLMGDDHIFARTQPLALPEVIQHPRGLEYTHAAVERYTHAEDQYLRPVGYSQNERTMVEFTPSIAVSLSNPGRSQGDKSHYTVQIGYAEFGLSEAHLPQGRSIIPRMAAALLIPTSFDIGHEKDAFVLEGSLKSGLLRTRREDGREVQRAGQAVGATLQVLHALGSKGLARVVSS